MGRANDNGRMSGKLDRVKVILDLRGCDDGPPKRREISDLIVRAIIAAVRDDEGPGSECAVVRALLQAHHAIAVAAHAAKGRDYTEATLRAAEAEKLWWHWVREGYVLAYEDADVSDDALPSWPDALPYEFDYEPGLLTRLAACAGYAAGSRSRQMRAYFAAECAKQRKCAHVPHKPDTLQTVCEKCGAEIVPTTPDSDAWEVMS